MYECSDARLFQVPPAAVLGVKRETGTLDRASPVLPPQRYMRDPFDTPLWPSRHGKVEVSRRMSPETGLEFLFGKLLRWAGMGRYWRVLDAFSCVLLRRYFREDYDSTFIHSLDRLPVQPVAAG